MVRADTRSAPSADGPESAPSEDGPDSAPPARRAARARPRGRRYSIGIALDWFFFVFAGLAAIWLAYLSFTETLRVGWWGIPFALAFWVLLAYLVLPRLHRILTTIYVPEYFIGRARTSDGLLGDPVNLALRGSGDQIRQAMDAAGWTRADDVSLRSSWQIISFTLTRRSYAEAPVSPLFLFGRQQDFAYQQEVAGNPAQRHHVRFWKCPEGWLLPGGYRVDWLAAGTFDTSVGLSLFTLQVTHRIDADTDIERDHIVETVTGADPRIALQVIRDFSTGYHARNGGGDSIRTDGDLPIIDVRALPCDASAADAGAADAGAAEASDAGEAADAGAAGAASDASSTKGSKVVAEASDATGTEVIAEAAGPLLTAGALSRQDPADRAEPTNPVEATGSKATTDVSRRARRRRGARPDVRVEPAKRPAFESAAPLLTPTGYDPDMPRPASTVAGATLVLLRVVAGVVWTIAAAAVADDWITGVAELVVGPEDATDALFGGTVAFVVANAVVLLTQTTLAVLILAGRNWPRAIVMAFAVISIAISFVGWWAGGLEIRITGTFLSLGLDILILLALSSRSAAAYARRNERR